MPASTINSILNRGILNSNVDNVLKICTALGIRPEVFSALLNIEDKSDIVSIYNKLEQPRQDKVLYFAKEQLDAQEQEENDLFEVTGISYAAAASGLGRGFDADDYDTYTVYTDEEPPRYDYAIGVRGDSMLPTYEAGDMLYIVDKGMSNYSGQLCIVAYNGQTYFKKVYTEPGGLRLVSLNKKYDDIFIDYPPAEDTYIKIYDVVGSFVPVEV
ncbi:TPA: helix-turn-helix transcriptional regulator [Streptococcus suis]|nr:helix-turn-helix transcriptional regulator [Streptococcus suis]